MDYPFISLGPTLHALALFLVFALLAGAIGLAIVLAILPGKIAASRQHPQAAAINVCGWVGLPTGIVWVVALVWAFYRDTSTAKTGVNSSELCAIESQLDQLDATVALLERQRKGLAQ